MHTVNGKRTSKISHNCLSFNGKSSQASLISCKAVSCKSPYGVSTCINSSQLLGYQHFPAVGTVYTCSVSSCSFPKDGITKLDPLLDANRTKVHFDMTTHFYACLAYFHQVCTSFCNLFQVFWARNLDWNFAELEMFVSEESTIIHTPEFIQLMLFSNTQIDGNNGCSAQLSWKYGYGMLLLKTRGTTAPPYLKPKNQFQGWIILRHKHFVVTYRFKYIDGGRQTIKHCLSTSCMAFARWLDFELSTNAFKENATNELTWIFFPKYIKILLLWHQIQVSQLSLPEFPVVGSLMVLGLPFCWSDCVWVLSSHDLQKMMVQIIQQEIGLKHTFAMAGSPFSSWPDS